MAGINKSTLLDCSIFYQDVHGICGSEYLSLFKDLLHLPCPTNVIQPPDGEADSVDIRHVQIDLGLVHSGTNLFLCPTRSNVSTTYDICLQRDHQRSHSDP